MLACAIPGGSAYAAPTSPPPAPPAEVEISFPSPDGTILHGTVLRPATESGERPAVVLVAGAGSTTRDDYRDEAVGLTEAGLVVLIYDKRPGYHRATASFPQLADDAVSALVALRAQPGVDPTRVGLWGHSQGGWVVSLAGARSPAPDFIITVSASGFPSDRTQLWSNRVLLRHAGVRESLIRPLGENLSRMLVSAGLFGDTTTDPQVVLPQVRQPVLAIFAERDRVAPPADSMAVFQQALKAGGNGHYAVRVLTGVDHNLRPSRDGYGPDSATVTPEHAALVAEWLDALPRSAIVVDPRPAQPSVAEPVRPAAFFEAGACHLGLAALILATAIGLPLAGLVRRFRGRRSGSLRGWPELIAALCGVVVVGAFGVLGTIVVTGARGIGPVALGRPVTWLILQLLTAVTLLLGVALGISALRSRAARAARWRLALAGASWLSLLGLAAYWGLLTW